MSDVSDTAMREEQDVIGRRRSDDTVLSILNLVPQPVCAVDSSSYKILYSNPALVQISQGSAQGPIAPGKLCYEVLAGRDTPCDTCKAGANESVGSSCCQSEMRSPTLGATFRIFSAHVRWAEEMTLFMFMTDVSDLHETTSALEKSEAHLRQLFDGTPSGAVRVDAAEIVLDANPSFCELFGYEREEVLGKPLNSLIVPPNRQDEAVSLSGQAMSSDPVHVETQRCRKDGKGVDVLIQGFPVLHRGAPIGFYATYTDVSARKRLERNLTDRMHELEDLTDRLRRSNNDLQEFAYVASHDLQEPLRMISSYTQLLEQRYADKLDADATDFIHYAVDGANRMQNLIQDILAFSRIESKGVEFRQIDLNSCLGRARANLEKAIVESEAIVHNDELPMILGDARQIEQLFQNLIANSLKFRGDAPCRVHVSVDDLGSEWKFAVRDNGIGFNPEMKDRIFVIFQRLHTRRKYPGTGIGLAICKRIVERHGGKIRAITEQGKGTSIEFTLPKKQSE